MEVRKVITGGVLFAAVTAGGLGLAGTASATPTCQRYCPTPPVVSHQKTVTVTKASADVKIKDSTVNQNAGTISQTADNGAGSITNNQNGVAASLPITLQVPLNVGGGTATGGATGDIKKAGSDSSASNKNVQVAKQDVVSVAKANESDNSTKTNTIVNSANNNGNSIGGTASAQNGNNSGYPAS